MTAAHRITVLGLGRMGTAIATRLATTGAHVRGWTRPGGPRENRATAGREKDDRATAGREKDDRAQYGLPGDGLSTDDRATDGRTEYGLPTDDRATDGLPADGLPTAGWATAGRTQYGLSTDGLPTDGRATGGFAAGGFTTVPDVKEAVAEADVVVLALFDGAACREVLDAVDGALRADAVVVNTATIAPGEASELARRLGPGYVHAPVLGSVPAVAAGALTLLAAAEEPAALDRVRPVLDALGTVRPVDGAATAAALKLVANHGLAGAVLALRDALHQADALGLPRDRALDVLERGPLGGLASRKRPHLLDGPPPATAEFTIGALAKDLALLAEASQRPLRGGTAPFGAPAAASDADIAAAATAPAVPDAVLAPLRAYVRGHATGDPRHFREAFLPTARVQGIRDSVLVSWPLDEYCALFQGRPAPDEATRTRRLDTVDVHGTVATATMTLLHGPDTFTDVFLLVRAGDAWRIADKAYHRHPAEDAFASSSAR
ncbi:nuclear transport factor 2 family protein [Streptomyces roseolus]|uniref:nuclear transport factor 2 family protein n=1 Tax=Streptomyces roseolus TaxID=67358 RepID=UPI0036679A44